MAVILLGGLLLLAGCNRFYFAHERWVEQFPHAAPQGVAGSALANTTPPPQWAPVRPLINWWAQQPLANWQQHGKVRAGRQLAARLAMGQPAATDSVNRYLQNAQPYGRPGTKWLLNPNGDYDFAEITLAWLLTYPPLANRLAPATRQHIAQRLLVEEPDEVHLKAPRSRGLMYETENHVLMREISRHLRMQFLLHSDRKPGFSRADWLQHTHVLHEALDELLRTGGYEFNANPYVGYTLTALLVLHDGTRLPRLRQKARECLDFLLENAAYGCRGANFAGPFRRRKARARTPELSNHPVPMVLTTLWAKHTGEVLALAELPHCRHHSLIAALSSYRPAAPVWKAWQHPPEGMVRIGHGPHSSPGIYTHGRGWILAAGGAWQGAVKQVVPRPTLLLLRGQPTHRDSTLHLPLPAKHLRVNYTGVWGRWAVGPRPFYVPPHYRLLEENPTEEGGTWQLYTADADSGRVYVAVYRHLQCGIVRVFKAAHPRQARRRFSALAAANAAPATTHSLHWGQGQSLGFALDAAKHLWVFTHHNGRPLQRDFYHWPVQPQR